MLESSEDLKDTIVVVETEEMEGKDHETPQDDGSPFRVFFMEDRGNDPVADDVETFRDGRDGWRLLGLGGFGPCLVHQLSVLYTGVGLVLHHREMLGDLEEVEGVELVEIKRRRAV